MNKPDYETLARLRVRIAELAGMTTKCIRYGFRYSVFNVGVPTFCGEFTTQHSAQREADELTARGWKCGEVKSYEKDVEPKDYTASLDAMHEAEKLLEPSDLLGESIPWDTYIYHLLETSDGTHGFHAEAWQRAIALDLTLSKEPIV